MKTAFCFATLFAGVSAFAPASQSSSSSSSSSLNAVDITKAVGAQAPLGCFDPLGIFPDKTAADEEQFNRLRWVELKHGRISMLAVVGYLVTQAGVRFPGAESIPAGFAALDNLPGMVWAQMLATMTMMEFANQDMSIAPWGTGDGVDGIKGGDFKGDFRNGALDFGWDNQSDDWKRRKRSIELNNGRAAMMGILGLMVHEKLGNLSAILPISN